MLTVFLYLILLRIIEKRSTLRPIFKETHISVLKQELSSVSKPNPSKSL